MTEAPRPGDAAWVAGNQQHLLAWLALVRGALSRYIARVEGAADPSTGLPDLDALALACATVAAGMPIAPAVDRIAAAFSLSAFETQIVVLCAGVELDAALARACARAHGDLQRAYPTFGLALAALPGAHWSALEPAAPLRAWRLVELVNGGSPGAPLTTRPLRLDERILHYLTGVGGLDERLARLTYALPAARPLVPTHEAITGRLAHAWQRETAGESPALVVHGADPISARAIVETAARQCGRVVLAMAEHAIPAGADEQAQLARLWDRDARLDPAVLLVEADDGSREAQRAGVLRDFSDRVSGPLVVVARERVTLGRRAVLSVEVGRPRRDEQAGLWASSLRDAGLDAALDLRELVAQFCLNAVEIRAAIDEARLDGGPHVTAAALWSACRRQARGALDSLAQRIESRATLDDLVLPDGQKETLGEIVTQVRRRALVYDTWGFARRGSRGLGISALFAGSSGTGKTMAAEVLAHTLELDLYRVDVSAVVSKYIGETEKNLRRIFDAAEAGGAVLLFDEADALFGKRSEVKDSHDRYANVEVSYLLQRMESYEGLAILTTNLKSALDTAFMRRIRFVVEFPFPDLAERARIWQRAFPSATPTHGLDVTRLAQLSVAGGGIRNVALGAAFLAADENEPVGMSHVLRAARSEYAKLARPLTDAEVAGWLQSPPC